MLETNSYLENWWHINSHMRRNRSENADSPGAERLLFLVLQLTDLCLVSCS